MRTSELLFVIKFKVDSLLTISLKDMRQREKQAAAALSRFNPNYHCLWKSRSPLVMCKSVWITCNWRWRAVRWKFHLLQLHQRVWLWPHAALPFSQTLTVLARIAYTLPPSKHKLPYTLKRWEAQWERSMEEGALRSGGYTVLRCKKTIVIL